jgi:tRNA pseudouridine32 synthase/23S rRNA pseudouridine746 synthase
LSAKAEIPDPFFKSFKLELEIPAQFNFISDGKPHPLCLLAAQELQEYLKHQNDWEHNFGLNPKQEGFIIGKMFGVLVVKTLKNELGYLAAFSGKLAGGNHHLKFVPPVFDSLQEGSFLNQGMSKLSSINKAIKEAEHLKEENYLEIVRLMKIDRKTHSNALQNELFNQYNFLNKKGVAKSLNEIFKAASYKNPPAGAGECAGPKLLQYAFQQQMEPLAIAEFWWGQSPKSAQWKHLNYYPCCKEKCEPILAHMLDGIEFDH